MELRGILSGLNEIKSRWSFPYPGIAVVSDSRYCTQGASTWMYKWKKNEWKKGINSKRVVLNADLWKEMFDLCRILNPSFFWVKGHSGNKYNEICDELSDTSAILRQEYSKSLRSST
jgi:ribonuclease HI